MEVSTKTGFNIQNLYVQACKILYEKSNVKFDKLNKYLDF